MIDHEPEDVKTAVKFFSDTVLLAELKSSSNLNVEYLSEKHGITSEVLEAYYKFSKFKYECGMYKDAEHMLGHYLSVTQTHTTSHLGALWGRLACRIVQANWTDSLEDFHAVKEAIEVRSIAPIDQLRQRAWLMHWGLFVNLNLGGVGIEKLADLFTEKVRLHFIRFQLNILQSTNSSILSVAIPPNSGKLMPLAASILQRSSDLESLPTPHSIGSEGLAG